MPFSSEFKSISMSRVCAFTLSYFLEEFQVGRTRGIFEILDEYNIEYYDVNIWFLMYTCYVCRWVVNVAAAHAIMGTCKSVVFCITVDNIKSLLRIKALSRRRQGKRSLLTSRVDIAH